MSAVADLGVLEPFYNVVFAIRPSSVRRPDLNPLSRAPLLLYDLSTASIELIYVRGSQIVILFYLLSS